MSKHPSIHDKPLDFSKDSNPSPAAESRRDEPVSRLQQLVTNSRQAMSSPWHSQNAPENFDLVTRYGLFWGSVLLTSFLLGVFFAVVVLL